MELKFKNYRPTSSTTLWSNEVKNKELKNVYRYILQGTLRKSLVLNVPYVWTSMGHILALKVPEYFPNF